MTRSGTVPDPPPGAQADRTRLAWIRTALAFMISSVVGLRVTVDEVGPAAIAITAACVLAAGAVLIGSRHRYRRAADTIDAPADLPDGRLPAVAGAIVLALGVLVIFYSFT